MILYTVVVYQYFWRVYNIYVVDQDWAWGAEGFDPFKYVGLLVLILCFLCKESSFKIIWNFVFPPMKKHEEEEVANWRISESSLYEIRIAESSYPELQNCRIYMTWFT
jgi:hypothetical protein